jgi:reductase EvaE/reductase VcaE
MLTAEYGEGTTLLRAMQVGADAAARATGRRVAVVEVDPPAPEAAIEGRHFIADVRQFSAHTGWRPQISLSEGIERAVKAAAGSAGSR